ncbi:GLPGLI family protein [Sphingobacterium sp. SRCM116780]|uniref:GLPGLI family protein n=1 Tax=Sphingobacterium sp. SRCM116780 TaxID=2907623 RepID=UPI001F282E6E|nr:GLPGLI family protein [Sphingobacterium sp. SRCM116780]UIR55677.1 GLPGLI family protein [Sphingobacterium sp. SRCM116780]
MKKLILSICILIIVNCSTYAQNIRFIRSGIITYQKTVNMYAIIQRGITKENETFFKPAFEAYKQQHPQFKELKSTLTFRNNKTLFTPIGNVTSIMSFFNDPQISMQNNVSYTDLDTKQFISKKKVFDDIYLLNDRVQNIKWKFTDEVRDIAGYPCRRANGIILDSVYMVAFYTDKIPVSGGPESFHGLPGMILQLALPHENVSWIATKIEDVNIQPDSILPPKDGTIINYKGLIDKLKSITKDDAKSESTNLKALLL